MEEHNGNKSVTMSDADKLCEQIENCMSGEIDVSRLSLKRESVNQLFTFCILIEF